MLLVKYSQGLAMWIDVGGESGDKPTHSHRRENNSSTSFFFWLKKKHGTCLKVEYHANFIYLFIYGVFICKFNKDHNCIFILKKRKKKVH